MGAVSYTHLLTYEAEPFAKLKVNGEDMELVENDIYAIKLTLDIRAKGGRYPIKLGVVLVGLDKKYIETVATRILLKDVYKRQE